MALVERVPADAAVPNKQARRELEVALVVPVCNEAAVIGLLVESIARQSRPPDEVIFVDAGSTDRSAELLRRACSARPGWRLLQIGPAFPGVARNAGVAATACEFIAFADAGTQLEDEWLDELCNAAKDDPETDIVFGNFEPVIDSHFKEWAALAYVPAPESRPRGRVRGPSIASSLLRRSIWEKVGGFPPFRAAEDLVFMESAARFARRIEYTPHATIHWQLAPDWQATFCRMANYSRHNLVANRGRYWHRGVFRNWALALICVVLALLITPWFYGLAFCGASLRVARTAWRKRGAFSFGSPFHPVRLMGVVAMLLVIDAATFWGALKWLWQDARGKGGADGHR